MFERRYLVFEDGSYYEGYKLGSDRLSIGEIVFNTAMTGYQERFLISYTGQIVTFTYPLIEIIVLIETILNHLHLH